MLAPEAGPAQRGRLEEIRDNLHDRIAEADREGWLGEIEGLASSTLHPERQSDRVGADARPAEMPRLPSDEIEADLLARRNRAESEGWLGEIEDIDLTPTFLRQLRGNLAVGPHRASCPRHAGRHSAKMT
jgi:hypothetical protein